MLVEKILPDIRKRLLCIKPHETLLQAAGLLDNGRDMLLVCDDARQLAGIITKTDVVRTIRRCSGASCTAPVTDAMTRDALTTTPKAWLHEAWKLMRVKGLKNLPVLDADGSVLGILNEWLHHYNHERTHQGKMCCGRTPIETMIDGKEIWKEKFVN